MLAKLIAKILGLAVPVGLASIMDRLSGVRRSGGPDGGAHDAVVLALGSHVGEPGLLEDAAGCVVEEGRGNLRTGGVLGVALDGPTTGLGDEFERPFDRDPRDAPPAIAPVDEDAGDSPVRRW